MNAADRKRAAKKVEESSELESPANFQFVNTDFRDLEIEPNSVDLVFTDPLWKLDTKRIGSTWDD